MVLTEGFLVDASDIWSDAVMDDLKDVLTAIEIFPRIGSRDVPASIRERFGEGVLKAVVPPFDLIYEYDEVADAVTVYGLVHFRQAR